MERPRNDECGIDPIGEFGRVEKVQVHDVGLVYGMFYYYWIFMLLWM